MLRRRFTPPRGQLHEAYVLTEGISIDSQKRRELFERLVSKAQTRYAGIRPVSRKPGFEECMTCHGNRVFLWFNTPDGSTHIVTEKLL